MIASRAVHSGTRNPHSAAIRRRRDCCSRYSHLAAVTSAARATLQLALKYY